MLPVVREEAHLSPYTLSFPWSICHNPVYHIYGWDLRYKQQRILEVITSNLRSWASYPNSLQISPCKISRPFGKDTGTSHQPFLRFAIPITWSGNIVVMDLRYKNDSHIYSRCWLRSWPRGRCGKPGIIRNNNALPSAFLAHASCITIVFALFLTVLQIISDFSLSRKAKLPVFCNSQKENWRYFKHQIFHPWQTKTPGLQFLPWR